MKTVLIIDDNAEIRAVMGKMLRSLGWRVLEAEGGDSGIELFRQHHPQLVLCDLLMPHGNGFEVCRAIRAETVVSRAKIIITSVRDYEADRVAARESGADAYLTKPISADALLETVAKLDDGVALMRGKDVARPDKQSAAATGDSSSPVRVKFWGVRGSIPSPGPSTVRYGGNTSCVEVRVGDEIIVLDAGTGMRGLGQSLMAEFQGRPLNVNLLLSHTHWDHIQGLPFFGPIYQANCRLCIFGYEGARKSLVHILSGQMESPYFPVPFQELPGNVEIKELKELQFQIGTVRVEAWFVNHPGICVGYRIFTDEGSLVYIPDNEPLFRHRIETAMWPNRQGVDSVEFAQEEEKKLIQFLSGADVLILDAQYDREEYQEHVSWGHGCVDDAVAIALRAGVKKLFLFHHDPDHDDAKVSAMLAHARGLVAGRGAKLEVDAATEGVVVQLAAISR